MIASSKQISTNANWPPHSGAIVGFTSSEGGVETAVLKYVRWGLVWRDFVLEDGRVIPEHRISGSPQPPEWREMSEVSDRERQECEELLLSMATSGMDPRKRDEWFWAELNQYLAFIYLKYKQAAKGNPQGEERTFGSNRSQL